MSGLNSAVSILELMGHENRALNSLGMGAAAIETLEGLHIESTRNPAMDPLKRGSSGLITRVGGLMSGPVPLLLRIAAACGTAPLAPASPRGRDFQRRRFLVDSRSVDTSRSRFRGKLAAAVRRLTDRLL